MWYCQFCDKEMLFRQSVVEVNEYITCGAGKCKQKAAKAYDALVTDMVIKDRDQRVKESEKTGGLEPALITVFTTTTPLVADSWKMVPIEDHPDSLRDPDVLAKMLNEGMQIQDTDYPGQWFHVMRTEDVREAMEKARTAGRVH